MTVPDPASSTRAPGRVWIINQWLPPDLAPTAVLCGELVALLQEMRRPLVLVSRARGADGQVAGDDQGLRRIVIDRLPHGPTGIISKLASWPKFAWRTRRVLLDELAPEDLVVVCSDPPLFYPLAIRAARRRGARVIHWSQDVYPDVVERHRPFPGLKALLSPLRAWRNAAVRRADRVVVISAGMGALMQAAGATTELIPNWARDDRIAARAPGDSQLRRASFDAGDFVVAYSGNLGRVHEFDTLVAAASRLRDQARIKFLIVGSGPRKPELEALVAQAGLQNFRFLPLQPEAQLSDTLAAGDAHFVSLRPEFESLVLPSKLYSIAAVGRPVLFCGDPNGETAALLAEHRFGLASPVGNGPALADAIRCLAADPARCHEFGRSARAMIDQHYSRVSALSRWRALIEGMPSAGCRGTTRAVTPGRG
jgi:glycosyltransferase involved in cell wall biosynthesis